MGAVQISTAVVVTIVMGIIGSFSFAMSDVNKKLDDHVQQVAAVKADEAATSATVAAMQTDIKDIKESQKTTLQILINLNKKL